VVGSTLTKKKHVQGIAQEYQRVSKSTFPVPQRENHRREKSNLAVSNLSLRGHKPMSQVDWANLSGHQAMPENADMEDY